MSAINPISINLEPYSKSHPRLQYFVKAYPLSGICSIFWLAKCRRRASEAGRGYRQFRAKSCNPYVAMPLSARVNMKLSQASRLTPGIRAWLALGIAPGLTEHPPGGWYLQRCLAGLIRTLAGPEAVSAPWLALSIRPGAWQSQNLGPIGALVRSEAC